MSQEANDPGAVSQETELPAGGDLTENPSENSKAPVQSDVKSDAGSSSDDSEDSAGPGFDSSSSSGESEEEEEKILSKRYQRPREIRRPMTGVRVLRAQLPPVRLPKPKEPFPCARNKGCCWSGKQQWQAGRGGGLHGTQQEDARLLICYGR